MLCLLNAIPALFCFRVSDASGALSIDKVKDEGISKADLDSNVSDYCKPV